MDLEAQVLRAGRRCLRDPIPEIQDAARYLDAAVSAHLQGKSHLAEELIQLSNIPAIRGWVESLWGKDSPYVQPAISVGSPGSQSKLERADERMPTAEQKQALHRRDGYRCRFCGIPVIRKEIRSRIGQVYPTALPWGHQNVEQHSAFQAMWAQYDHVIPYARGGTNDLENLVIACAPCNFGRMNYTLEEVGLDDPRCREPVPSYWDGLERFR